MTGSAETGEPGEPQPGRVRGAPLIAAAAALLLYVVVPLISLGRTWGLTNYDDPFVASADNPAIGEGWGGFWSILPPWGEAFMHAWLPLYYGSLGLDNALFGDAFVWWHVHSAVLWAVAAGLVVLVARALGLRGFAPLTAGIVLAVHPVGVESVAWIASRKEQLSLVWSLVAVLAYLRAV